VTRRVHHLNAFASAGVAARAVVRVHKALIAEGASLGLPSQFHAMSGAVSGPGVCVDSPFDAAPIWRRLHPRLADAFQQEHLAQCIAAMVANPEQQRAMAQQARQQAEDLWHPKRIAAQYASVYDEVLERSQ